MNIDFPLSLEMPLGENIRNAGKEWMTTEEAACFLRLPVGTLRNWTSAGKVPYRKFGRLNRYKKSELEDLLETNKRGPR